MIVSQETHHVIVMTKEVGYVRKPTQKELPLIKLRYLRYPKVYELMKERHLTYNSTVQFIEEQEKLGNVFIIRPKFPNDVGRVERDKARLDALYEEGYQDAKDCYQELIAYLEK